MARPGTGTLRPFTAAVASTVALIVASLLPPPATAATEPARPAARPAAVPPRAVPARAAPSQAGSPQIGSSLTHAQLGPSQAALSPSHPQAGSSQAVSRQTGSSQAGSSQAGSSQAGSSRGFSLAVPSPAGALTGSAPFGSARGGSVLAGPQPVEVVEEFGSVFRLPDLFGAAGDADPVSVPVSPGPGLCPTSLNVVAHQDDDLLFVNPAVSDDLAAGRCVVTVFVTAGDAGRRPDYWLGREAGAKAAYASMTGLPDVWDEDSITVRGRRIARATLPGDVATLLFLRLPDNHGNPRRPGQTLRRLWTGAISRVGTLDAPDFYTRAGLIATLTALMDGYQPDEIRTLDYTGAYGDGDHADHHTVGYLTYEAQRHYRSPHRVTAYLGYLADGEPATLAPAERAGKLSHFLAYAQHGPRVCQTAARCLTNFYAPRFTHNIPAATEVADGGRGIGGRGSVLAQHIGIGCLASSE